MKIKYFKTEKELILAATNLIKEISRKKPTSKIALSGGNTPKNLYKHLSKKSFTKSLHFYQVDERCNDASNLKLINSSLKPKHFTHFNTSLPIKSALKTYREQIKKVKFDLCILGIGEDGHTASLFPNSKALKSRSTVAHSITTRFPGKNRLTITFPKILESKTILVLLKEKEKILKLLKSDTSSASLPFHKLKKHKKLLVFYKK